MKALSSALKLTESVVELKELVAKWRESGETIVFTNGVFDILHKGHLALLEKASQLGDRLIVAVNSDQSARYLGKGPGRPINDQYHRALLVAGMGVVDAVVIFDQPTPEEVIKEIQPDVLVKGADWQEDRIVGRQYARQVVRISLEEGYSTTNLIEKILQNYNVGVQK
ncbi:MAG: pantoate--beta-alanine ligase [bacterium]